MNTGACTQTIEGYARVSAYREYREH